MTSKETLKPDQLSIPEFLERERAMKSLREMYQTARKGHKRCAILAAEKGGGKTRMFETFRKQEMSGAQHVFVVDFAVPGPEIRARPLILLLGDIRRQHGKLPDEVTASDRSLEVDVGTIEFIVEGYKLDSTEDVLGTVHSSEEKFWSAMTRFVVEHAKRKGVNILLENVERADPVATRFLEFFFQVPEEPGAHLFVVATYTSDDTRLGNHFGKILSKIKRSDLVEQVTLPPLSSRAVPSFFASAIGRVAADDVVYREAFRMSKGNPTMLYAVVRSLAERGAIAKTSAGWKIEASGAEISALPPEKEAQLVAAAKRLGKKHRDTTEWAAVSGVEFELDLVAGLAGVGGTHLGFVVTDMTRDRFWDEVEGSKPRRFSFPSPVVRKAIYDSVAEKQRKKMHLAIAKELEKKSPPPAEALAIHYALADSPKLEQQWTQTAGEVAFRKGQWVTAEKFFGRVLEMLKVGGKKTPPAELAHVQYWLGRTHRKKRDLHKADEAIKEGMRQIALAKDASSELLKAEHALLRCDRRDATAFDAVKAMVELGGEAARLPELIVAFADFLRLRNRPQKAAEWIASISREHPDFPVAEGAFQLQAGRLAFVTGDWEACEKALVRGEEVCREQQSFGTLAQVLYSLAELREVQGQIPLALQLTESGIQYAADSQDPSIEARLWALSSRLLQKYGQAEEGMVALQTARKRAKTAARDRITAYVLLETARWGVHTVNFDKALEAGRKALELFERIKERWGGAICYQVLGRLYLRARNIQQAHQYFKFSMEYFRELGALWMGAFLAPSWGNVVAHAGKLDRQKKLLDEGLEVATKHKLPEARALILLELGRLATDPAVAKEMSREAYELLRECGNRLEAKRARMLFEREKGAAADAGEDAIDDSVVADEPDGAADAAVEPPVEPEVPPVQGGPGSVADTDDGE